MANNQDTQTGENIGGETPAGEHHEPETASAAGTVPESNSPTAQPEAGWDTATAGTGQPADVGSTAESVESSNKPAAEPAPTPPSGAQLSPNAPRTVKKPADMKPIASPTPEATRPASQTARASTAAATGAASQIEEQPAADVDFGAILDQFESEQTIYHAGELVEGKVVGISDRGILIDFGYKSEGLAPVEDFSSPEGEVTVNVGDPVEVVIRTIHTGDAPPQLSRTDALNRKSWSEIEAAYREEAPVIGKIVDKTKGGLKVEINGIEAFLPGSQIDSRPIRQLDTYIGEEIEAKIIKFSRRRNNIVLSRKVITDEVVNKQKAETLENIDIGYIVEGTIKNLTEYGAFVDIGGIDGLLHVTDMSWGRLHHPSEMFKQGEHVQVKVLKLDREKEKISLGFKQLLPDPWSTVTEVYHVNSKVRGKVSSVTDYGVFVELEPGVEGLVHVSEISWSKRSVSPKRMFNKGDDVDVQVLGVDTVEKRISLGMKQFADNPWETVDIKYPVGSKVHGKVRNITDFGAFVELEEGIDGLVHVSDITWAKKVKHPKELLKKDQEVDAIVTNIDKRGQRLSLSMKDLMPSAWESFVATHRPGDVVRGKVTRFTSFGVFVELGEGLEGLCHISELADQRVEKPEDIAQIGQEMDFKILRIEHEDQKIGLSHRAVGKHDEAVVDTKMYSTEAKGGMASLAELANINLGATKPASEKGSKKKERRGEQVGPSAETEAPPEAASPADGATETAAAEPTETLTENAPEAQAETSAPEEVAPESITATSEAELESTSAEPSNEIETPPAESASQPQTEAEEAVEESEQKSA
ncbi:MAG TPA: 30S ribosomal protein S1 [Pyrinomonadaceae bacterium]